MPQNKEVISEPLARAVKLIEELIKIAQEDNLTLLALMEDEEDITIAISGTRRNLKHLVAEGITENKDLPHILRAALAIQKHEE